MSGRAVVAASLAAGLVWWGIQSGLDAPPDPPAPHAVTTTR